MGGTCLRIVYNLNRFSEDLDFDILTKDADIMPDIARKTVSDLNTEGIDCKLVFAKTGNTAGLKFPGLPYQLGLSNHENENIHIKIDWDVKGKVFKPEIFLLSRFNSIRRINVNSESVILAEKIAAVCFRNRSIPRDFYDIVQLLGRNIQPEADVLAYFDIKSTDVKQELISRFKELQSGQMKNELSPFLFSDRTADWPEYFIDLVNTKL
jgi:predicted nucleotidyltransferase component of viral defense system